MKTNKITKMGILILIVSFFAINSVNAFAISSAYWKDNPVQIYPGESKEIYIVLQNMAGEEDVRLQGSITEGFEIAKIIDLQDIYDIPLGEHEIVNIKINIPKEAIVGETQYIKAYFKTVPEEGAPTLGLGTGIQKSIPILIIEKPISTSPLDTISDSWQIYLIIGISLILIIIIIIILIKRKKKKIEEAQQLRINNPTNFK